MKIDYDLVRTLLLQIEDITDGRKDFSIFYFSKCLPDVPIKAIDYHLKYLIDSGMVEGVIWEFVTDITPYGREYLNSIRNDSIWSKTKERIQPLGSVALDVVSELGKSFVLEKIGL